MIGKSEHGAHGSRPIHLVVFDCDGTLIDSFAAIIAAFQSGWRLVDREPPPEYILREAAALPLEGAIMRLDRGLTERQLTTIADHYRKSLAACDSVLLPGVRDMLADLRSAGLLLGIATGMSRDRLDTILTQHGLGGAFDTLQTADKSPGKPSPQMLLQATGELGVDVENTIMVGDAVQDMAMARNARVIGIGVTWGVEAGPTLELAGASRIVSEFPELTAAVLDCVNVTEVGG
jgi:phosphoglycolate phosphatase